MKPDERTLRDLYEVQGLGTRAVAEQLGIPRCSVPALLRRHGITVRPPTRTPEKTAARPDRATLRELYETKGLTTHQIAERLGVRQPTVLHWLHRYEIKPRGPGRWLKSRWIEPPGRDELLRLVHADHVPLREIAARFGVSRKTVQSWIDRHGIEPPTTWGTKTKGNHVILDPDEVWALYQTGLSMEQIGAVFGVSLTVVAGCFEKHGMEARPSGYNSRRYTCSDGTEVKSSYELRVAEWLIASGVAFVYEPHYPFNKRLKADFSANGWYIEIWGITGEDRYTRQKRRKIRLCQTHGVPLIQIRSDHFMAEKALILEERLSKVLSPAPAIGAQGMLF